MMVDDELHDDSRVREIHDDSRVREIREKVHNISNATATLLDDLLDGHGLILSRLSKDENHISPESQESPKSLATPESLESKARDYRSRLLKIQSKQEQETVDKLIRDSWALIVLIGTVIQDHVSRIKSQMSKRKGDDHYMDAAKLVEVLLKGYVMRIDALRNEMKLVDPRKMSETERRILL